MTPFSGTIDAAPMERLRSAVASDLARQTHALAPLLTTMPESYGYAPPSLTEADVRRIVREELEAVKPSPLDVTPEDVRRWAPGLKS